MGQTYGFDALQFLIGIVIDLYALVVVLRFLLQVVDAHYFNPVAQFVVQATRPVLGPLRRVLPSADRYDIAALVVALVLMLIKIALVRLLSIDQIVIGGYAVGIAHVWLGSLVWLAVVDLLTLFINVWFFAVLILAVLSWIAPSGPNPVHEILEQVTRPVLRPVRRVIPLIGGVDLSPLVVLIGLQVLKMLLVRPLLALA
jgi:YggT family protein